jgi:hypothetical protein
MKLHGLMMKRIEVKVFGQKCAKFWSKQLLRMKKEKNYIPDNNWIDSNTWFGSLDTEQKG